MQNEQLRLERITRRARIFFRAFSQRLKFADEHRRFSTDVDPSYRIFIHTRL